METILEKGFAQAQVPLTLVLWCMHECLCKTLFQDCPHGEVAFSNSGINNVKTHNNLLLKAKGRKKLVKLQYVIIYYGEMKS